MINTISNVLLQRYKNSNKNDSSANEARISPDGMLAHLDRHLENFDTLIHPLPDAKPRTPFDDKNIPQSEMTMMNFSVAQRLKILPEMVPLMLNMQLGARMYTGKFQPKQDEASPEFIAELEQMALDAGVKDIGYVKVPRSAIFADKGIPEPYAIVFTVEMEQEPIETAPSFDCQLEVMRGYKNMAQIANKLARFLQRHGFAAYPGTSLGGVTDYPMLAELAGLGTIGYHGLLISPGEGARLRINTIYTNITNLPTLQAQGIENEHAWVRDFCAMCKKCVRQCPPQAIYDEPRPRYPERYAEDGVGTTSTIPLEENRVPSGRGMQTIDHDACRGYFQRNYGCGICLAVCPFSHSGYEKVHARFKGNPDAPQFRIDAAA